MIAPTVQELIAGWRPVEDNAAIAIRAYQSLSLHPPLVGQATAASMAAGHSLFDPGPLLFYLLAVPVRISPTFGLLIGAMILVGVVLSLAIEATWSAGQWVAGAVVALTVLDLLWLMPAVFQSLPWNAYFPLPFFLSSVVLAWVVSLGRVRWWPVLVASASIAAQSHLLFLIPAVALIAVSLVVGLLRTRRFPPPGSGAGDRGVPTVSPPPAVRSLRWVGIGLGVGLICWLAPLIQTMGSNGNLSNLVDSRQATFGLSFGFRQVGQAFDAPPVWLTRLPNSFYTVVHFAFVPEPWHGVVVLGLLALVAVGAFASGRWELGTLATVATATAVSFIYAFAIFPTKNAISLGYLINAIWILTILEWCVLIWGLLCLVNVGLQRMHRPVPAASVARRSVVGALVLVWTAAAGVGLWSVLTSPAQVNWTAHEVHTVDRATAAIEQQVPRGPVNLRVVSSDFIGSNFIAESVAYRLLIDGWSPGVSSVTESYTGLTVPSGSHAPTIVVTVDSGGALRSVAPQP